MAISTQVPPSQLVPLYWVNVDGSMAGNLTQQQPALLVGVSNSAAPQAQNTPLVIATLAQAQNAFGIGWQLERMIASFLNNNVTQLLYAVGIPQAAAGVVATGTVTITAAPTTPGTYTIYIAGQIVQILVQTTDTPTTIATNLAAAINAMGTLPVTATTSTGTVTVTCKWKGISGNDITMLENYGGPNAGQYMPVGMTTTVITPLAGGTGTPDYTTAIANTAPGNYVHIALGDNDTITFANWSTETGFGPTGRWNYVRQQYAWCYAAHRSTSYSTAITWGQTNNLPTISSMEIEPRCPSTFWEVAAAYCGRGASAFLDDPARPLQTLEMMGIVPANLPDRYTSVQQNNLTANGLAIQTVDAAGNMMILREATTYQKNMYGQGDTAFALLTILSTLATLLSRQRAAITSKFARYKLAPDGTRYGPGQAIVTPTSILAELVAEARLDEWDGLVADVDWFKNNLIVEIDDQNPNRVNVLYPPRLIGQLRIFAVLAQFRLLLPQDSGIQP
jgi:phage tail sheath gpL-like